MKYVLLTIAAVAICGGIGIFFVVRAHRKERLSKKKMQSALYAIEIIVVLVMAALFVFLGMFYNPEGKAWAAMEGNGNVTVSRVRGGYFFDGSSEDTAMVFYPGGRVACEAYAPLMLSLAENGCDCFLAEMPMNLALFDMNAAEKYMNAYSYDIWLLGGHSLGGVSASVYAQNHAEEVDGMMLLAAYPSVKTDDSVKVCLLYGSEDGCLEMDKYEESRENWPENTTEVVIEGGNHSQFGDYGHQRGDGEATIPAEEQIRQTVDALKAFFEE